MRISIAILLCIAASGFTQTAEPQTRKGRVKANSKNPKPNKLRRPDDDGSGDVTIIGSTIVHITQPGQGNQRQRQNAALKAAKAIGAGLAANGTAKPNQIENGNGMQAPIFSYGSATTVQNQTFGSSGNINTTYGNYASGNYSSGNYNGNPGGVNSIHSPENVVQSTEPATTSYLNPISPVTSYGNPTPTDNQRISTVNPVYPSTNSISTSSYTSSYANTISPYQYSSMQPLENAVYSSSNPASVTSNSPTIAVQNPIQPSNFSNTTPSYGKHSYDNPISSSSNAGALSNPIISYGSINSKATDTNVLQPTNNIIGNPTNPIISYGNSNPSSIPAPAGASSNPIVSFGNGNSIAPEANLVQPPSNNVGTLSNPTISYGISNLSPEPVNSARHNYTDSIPSPDKISAPSGNIGGSIQKPPSPVVSFGNPLPPPVYPPGYPVHSSQSPTSTNPMIPYGNPFPFPGYPVPQPQFPIQPPMSYGNSPIGSSNPMPPPRNPAFPYGSPFFGNNPNPALSYGNGASSPVNNSVVPSNKAISLNSEKNTLPTVVNNYSTVSNQMIPSVGTNPSSNSNSVPGSQVNTFENAIRPTGYPSTGTPAGNLNPSSEKANSLSSQTYTNPAISYGNPSAAYPIQESINPILPQGNSASTIVSPSGSGIQNSLNSNGTGEATNKVSPINIPKHEVPSKSIPGAKEASDENQVNTINDYTRPIGYNHQPRYDDTPDGYQSKSEIKTNAMKYIGQSPKGEYESGRGSDKDDDDGYGKNRGRSDYNYGKSEYDNIIPGNNYKVRGRYDKPRNNYQRDHFVRGWSHERFGRDSHENDYHHHHHEHDYHHEHDHDHVSRGHGHFDGHGHGHGGSYSGYGRHGRGW